MNPQQVEIGVANYFGWRSHIIVPNVSWGLFRYEMDMTVVTDAGFGYEVEIKISKSDLVADLKKQHRHENRMIKKLFFAMPKKMEPHIALVPPRAGVFLVDDGDYMGCCKLVRAPQINKNCVRWTPDQIGDLMRLGTMRIWSLKEALHRNFKKRLNP